MTLDTALPLWQALALTPGRLIAFNAALDVISTAATSSIPPLSILYGVTGLVRLIASMALYGQHEALTRRTKAAGDLAGQFEFAKGYCSPEAARCNVDNSIDDALRNVDQAQAEMVRFHYAINLI